MPQTAANPPQPNTPPPIDLSEFGAKPVPTSTTPGNQPVDLSEFGAKPVVRGATGTQPKQPSAWDVLTQPTEKTDKEYLGYTGLPGVVGATVHGANNVARGTIGAVKGTVKTFGPQQPNENAFTSIPIVRILRGLYGVGKQALDVPAAIHDINQSVDPTGAYLDAAEGTASEGAGQALTSLAAEAAPKALATTSEIVKRTVPPVVRTVAKTTNTMLAKAPEVIGGSAGAAVAHASRIPGAAPYGVALGAGLGRAFLPRLRVPGENFGVPQFFDKGAPLPASPPTGDFVEPASEAAAQAQPQPPVAPAEVVHPKLLPATASGVSRRVPGQVAPEDVSAPDASTLAGRKGIRIVLPGKPKQLPAAPEPATEPAAAQPAAEAEIPEVTTAPKVAPAKVSDLLNQGLGNEPAPKPVPGKPIYSRTPAKASTIPVPEGMTAVKSNGMRAYSYDAPTQTFTAQWPDGALHRYGEVTPEEVKAFEAADSKGRALLQIANNHVHLAANYGHGWINKAPVIRSAAPGGAAAVSARPATTAAPVETSVPGDLTSLLQQSVEAAKRTKATGAPK